jgi:1-deoxy-D-xylulose-5-phosphate reductoisomerase
VTVFGKTNLRAELPGLKVVCGRTVTVLGSTGSVGKSTLSVIAHARQVYGPHAFPIAALTAQTNVEVLAKQAKELRPALAVIGEPSLYQDLKQALSGTQIEVAAGKEAVVAAAERSSDLVMVAIVGAAGLEPALAAVRRNAIVALANKECIVSAGAIFREEIRKNDVTVIPVDSEHNAAFQILDFSDVEQIQKLTITASGGPFREWTRERMADATPQQAIAHPNWSMGAKISVDSATLMNKGLEVIEAHYLFSLPPEKLDVLVHPQSIIHCLVSFSDGTTLAHLSAPDMRTPISHAMAWPRRMSSPSRSLDLASAGSLTFLTPDPERFPCLQTAMDCLRAGGNMPNVLNAANEVAVRAFLERRIGFLDIQGIVQDSLEIGSAKLNGGEPADLDTVLAVDLAAREIARQVRGRFEARHAVA